jgi:hypothetical protein
MFRLSFLKPMTKIEKDLQFLIKDCKIKDDEELKMIIEECQKLGVSARYYLEEFTSF